MKNKHVWLIGASEGIGAALAEKLAAEGAVLTVSARNAERLQTLAASLAGNGHRAVAADVTSLESLAEAWRSFGDSIPDMVIYNAGTYKPMDVQHFELEPVEAMLDVNLRGAFRLVSLVIPAFLQRNAGHFVLVGSVAGYRGLPSAMGYGASKAGIMHLAENLKADLKDTSVRVQLVSPGFVKTRLTDMNDFKMPCIITAERAAQYIVDGLNSSRFEIHFPKRFSVVLKLLSLLPAWMYFRLV